MDYDKFLLKIGEFGWWQKKVFLLLMVPSFIAGMLVMTTAFTTWMPKEFSCNEECDNLTDSAEHVQANLTRNQLFVYLNTLGYDDVHGKPESCEVIKFKKINNTCTRDDGPKKLKHCDEKSDYVYNKIRQSSVITDNKIMCMTGIKTYKPVCDTFFMVGYFFGGFFFGLVADTYGRRISLALAIFFCFVGSGLGPLAQNHWAYAVTRIIPGAGSIGCFLIAFDMVLEIVGKKEQLCVVPWNMTIFSFVGNIIAVPFALGEASNGLLAMIFKRWESFQFSVTFFCGISGIVWFFIPESPRWLIETNKMNRAKKLVMKAAETNGKQITEDELETDAIDEESDAGIFHPVLRKSTHILFVIWTAVTFIYYGTSFGIEGMEMTENIYLGVGLVALVEIPAYFITAMVMDVFGRKPILIFTLLVSAVSCFVAASLDQHSTFAKILVLIAKFCISSTFAVVRIYTCELYPTNIRATALGTCKSVSSIGAIAAPWVGEFLPNSLRYLRQDKWAWAGPFIFYGVCSGLAGILSFQLADTVGFPLPSTIEDVQQIKRFQKPMFKLAGPNFDPTQTRAGDEEEDASDDNETSV